MVDQVDLQCHYAPSYKKINKFTKTYQLFIESMKCDSHRIIAFW